MRLSSVLVARVLGCAGLALAACDGAAKLPVSSGTGPQPVLPPPKTSLIPTVKIAPVKGWSPGQLPVAAPGLRVAPFAVGLDHPRWLYTLPNGDVLVAETNAPPKPEDGKGLRGWLMKREQKKAGGGVPSANRITLLRDTDGDGRADTTSPFLEQLSSPLGMALVGSDFYVAATDALWRFPYTAGAKKLEGPGTKVLDLPAGPLNHHWAKNVVATADGSKLYVSVGSNSNAGENGLEKEAGRAAIWEIEPRTGAHRIFASGLRNPVGMAFTPDGTLWTSVNERDELGSDLVPDYLTSVRDGAFYGFPFSYYGQHVDPRVKPQRPDLVARAIAPDYALGPHTASLGLAYRRVNALGTAFDDGMFVGQHGSWNRKPRSGYKVIFVPFDDNKPKGGQPVDVLTGFVDEQGEALGRPVGVAFDKTGALLVADDVGNRVWRVESATPGPAHASR
jgi:glucose/arabinose dehydrogenase